MAKSKSGLAARFQLARDEFIRRTIASISGEVGCIAGDMLLAVRRQERHTRPITMSELHRKFNGGGRWDNSPTYLQSFADDETLFYNRIVAVTESGVKETVSVSFDDGSILRATPDHPVLTSSGFVEAGALQRTHRIVGRGTCGLLKTGRRPSSERPSRVIVNLKYHPFGGAKHVDIYHYTRVQRSRLVIEAVANNLSYEEFISILQTDEYRARRLRFLPRWLEVHHLDENTMNDTFDNLVILTCEEHARLHGKQRKASKYDLLRTKRIAGVGAVRQAPTMTFDIQMTAPAHNFCVADTVVHNTGKTYFGCTGPAPILLQNIDKGTEGVVELFRKEGKEIYEELYEWSPGEVDDDDERNLKEETQLKEAAIEVRNKWEKDYFYGVENGVRTAVMDNESRIWQVYRYAEFGGPNGEQRDYDKLNLRFEELINRAKACEVNLLMMRSMKDRWGMYGKPKADGKKSFAKSGREVWGYEHLAGQVFMELEFVRRNQDEQDEAADGMGEYVINIGKCRQNMDLQFSTIPRCSLPELGTLIFPETEIGDWE